MSYTKTDQNGVKKKKRREHAGCLFKSETKLLMCKHYYQFHNNGNTCAEYWTSDLYFYKDIERTINKCNLILFVSK